MPGTANIGWTFYPSGGACPFVIPFETLINLTESPSGTFNVIVNSIDADGKNTSYSLPASTNGEFQIDEDFTLSTDQTAICWDVSNILTPSYYTTARYVGFTAGGTYWYNDNQGGSTDTTISAATGDILGLARTGTNTIILRYFRTSSWTTLYTFSGTQTGELFYYISSAALGSTQKILNPKHCGAVAL